MPMLRRPTTTAIALLVLSGCEPGVAPAPSAANAASPAQSAALFLEHCAICHGEIGDGHGPRRGSLFRKPPDFRDLGWRAGKTLPELRAIIRDGRRGTDMPPWRTLGEPAIAGLAEHVLWLGEALR